MLYGLFRSVAGQKKKLADLLQSPVSLLLVFVSIYSLIHLLSWSLIRYRLPVDAVLLIFAGLAVVDITERIIIRVRLRAKNN
jgi:fumarate reductase subunit D